MRSLRTEYLFICLKKLFTIGLLIFHPKHVKRKIDSTQKFINKKRKYF